MFTGNMRMTPLDCYGLGGHRGRFGVELELEGDGFPIQELTPGWHVHAEGSIRGSEYATSVPHNLDGIRDRINNLNEVFRMHGTRINLTHRGSTHIHFNVQREQLIHILGLMILFTIVEPVFLRLCGNERDGNLFCLPSYDTGDIHLHFERLLTHICNPRETHFPPRGKYSSMNINPIPRQGSVEFRTFPSSNDPEKVIQWCTWIENMMTMVKRQHDLSFRDIQMEFKHRPETVNLLFGPVEELIQPHGLYELIGIGLQNGHEMRRLLSMYLKGYKSPEEEQ